jgi:hypothetical protein
MTPPWRKHPDPIIACRDSPRTLTGAGFFRGDIEPKTTCELSNINDLVESHLSSAIILQFQWVKYNTVSLRL